MRTYFTVFSGKLATPAYVVTDGYADPAGAVGRSVARLAGSRAAASTVRTGAMIDGRPVFRTSVVIRETGGILGHVEFAFL